MLGAVMFGHQQMQAAIQAINELADDAGKPMWDWTAAGQGRNLVARVARTGRGRAARRLSSSSKSRRVRARSMRIWQRVFAEIDEARKRPDATHGEAQGSASRWNRRSCAARFSNGEPRIDGRDTRTVRPITIRTGVLPRTHGSALFTRGETQAMVVATLGTGARRADHRRADGRIQRALHAPLQFSPVRHR